MSYGPQSILTMSFDILGREALLILGVHYEWESLRYVYERMCKAAAIAWSACDNRVQQALKFPIGFGGGIGKAVWWVWEQRCQFRGRTQQCSIAVLDRQYWSRPWHSHELRNRPKYWLLAKTFNCNINNENFCAFLSTFTDPSFEHSLLLTKNNIAQCSKHQLITHSQETFHHRKVVLHRFDSYHVYALHFTESQ